MDVKIRFVVGNQEFVTPEEALAYEQRLRSYLMYDDSGRRVEGPDCAVFVFFPDADACRRFIEDCKEEGADYEGIDYGCTGLWRWECGEYFHVDESIVEFFMGLGAQFE